MPLRRPTVAALFVVACVVGGCSAPPPPPGPARLVLADEGGWSSTYVTEGPQGTTFAIADRSFFVYFDRSSSAPTERGRSVIRAAGERLLLLRRAAAGEVPNTRTSFRDARLLVVGHANDGGSAVADWELSIERAQRVAEELQRTGVRPDLIAAEGRGGAEPQRRDDPLNPNNRYVMIHFTDGEPSRASARSAHGRGTTR